VRLSPSHDTIRSMPSRIWEKLVEFFAAERERWPLWLPVLFAFGVGFYFALPVEPPLWLGAALMPPVCLLGWIFRLRQAALLSAIAISALIAGFVVAQTHAVLMAAPTISRPIGPTTVIGRVVEVEKQLTGQRVTLDRLSVSGLKGSPPHRVRVKLPRHAPETAPGERLSLQATLMPPPTPSLPGGYDFARQAWFDRLGAVGYAYTAKRLSPVPSEGIFDRFAIGLSALRHELTGRISKAIGGDAGAVAAALMTGERSGISSELNEAYRNSGLYHLLSISGLHMAMVAGLALMVVRRLFALSEFVALRYPIKKWAAAVAVLVTFAYLLISGLMAPSLRSFFMTCFVLLGVLLDRQAISMRLVAWATVAVLLYSPDSLLGPSFQMSFAAVVALIAAYEGPFSRFNAGGWGEKEERPWWRKPVVYVIASIATTIVATLATAPYALYHFNRLAPYGLVANLLALPLTGIAVMPLIMVAFLLMPFGLENWALQPLGWAVKAVNLIALEVGGWKGAGLLLPEPSFAGLIAVTFGGLWLCLWQGSWRKFGLLVIIVGMVGVGTSKPPDILIATDFSPLAVRAEDGRLLFAQEKGNNFARDIWIRRNGGDLSPGLWPSSGIVGDGLLACDGWGCLYSKNGHRVAFVKSAEALDEDCRQVDLVVSLLPIGRQACKGGAQKIDRYELLRKGTHILRLDPEGLSIETVAEKRGDRLWSKR
jgi:competence protein ComEC